jgi:pyruvate ferredoxin oxidoreductase delta subunit
MILEAGNSVDYHTGDWRAFRPVWGEGACTHCFLCWLYCPDSSILADAENERMAGFDLDHCKGCGICAAVCPVNAKVMRQAAQELDKDDLRLCIRMIEEPRGAER